jgi:hypothetical protein
VPAAADPSLCTNGAEVKRARGGRLEVAVVEGTGGKRKVNCLLWVLREDNRASDFSSS